MLPRSVEFYFAIKGGRAASVGSARSIDVALPSRVMSLEVACTLSIGRAERRSGTLAGVMRHDGGIIQESHADGVERGQHALRVGARNLFLARVADERTVGALDLADIAAGDYLRDVFDVHGHASAP